MPVPQIRRSGEATATTGTSKDIFLYKDHHLTIDGLVQQTVQIVDRFALTI